MIVVVPAGSQFIIRTDSGLPVGNRMISSAPEPGRAWPPEQTVFDKKTDADRAALAWNAYLIGVRKHKKGRSPSRAAADL